MAPAGGKARGGRGRGGGEESAPPTGGDSRKGAGRGNTEQKDGAKEEGEGGKVPPAKFNAQDASEWLSARYSSVMEEYDKQKQSGKKGDIQHFSDLNAERSAWTGGAKPIIPPKDDFLHQLQVSMTLYQQRKDDPK
mmetsp:Transcript_83150/g.174070  ORF Transcript_83150/g.174070 Transcript_83150/m.174070 type:complete len:136 (+) Transcript_83150:181-588(+)